MSGALLELLRAVVLGLGCLTLVGVMGAFLCLAVLTRTGHWPWCAGECEDRALEAEEEDPPEWCSRCEHCKAKETAA